MKKFNFLGEGFLFDLTRWAVPVILVISLMKLESILYLIPIFQIKKVELSNGSRLVPIVKNNLLREAKNNYVILRINFVNFVKSLERNSRYYIKDVKIKGFDFTNGILRLELTLRKPLAKLSDGKYIAYDGKIFDYFGKIDVPLTRDLTRTWHYGERFSSVNWSIFRSIALSREVKEIDITENSLTVKGGNFSVTDDTENFKWKKAVGILRLVKSSLRKVKYVKLALFGRKSYLLKTE